MFTKVEAKPSFPDLEKTVLDRWQPSTHSKSPSSVRRIGPKWVFYDGPPFPTGSPHYGTIFVSILKDVIRAIKRCAVSMFLAPGDGTATDFRLRRRPRKILEIIRTSGRLKRRSAWPRSTTSAGKSSPRSIQHGKVYIDRIGRWVDFDHPYPDSRCVVHGVGDLGVFRNLQERPDLQGFPRQPVLLSLPDRTLGLRHAHGRLDADETGPHHHREVSRSRAGKHVLSCVDDDAMDPAVQSGAGRRSGYPLRLREERR